MPSNITTEQHVELTVTPLTLLGNSASLSGIPAWSSSNINVVTLSVASNGLSASAIGVGVGSSIISVMANSNLNDTPIVQVSGSIDINVSLAQAATLNIQAGTPISN